MEILSDDATDQSYEREIIRLETGAYGGTSIFSSNTATFDKMQQSGEMGIVTDNALYREIVDYYQEVGSRDRNLMEDWLGRWRNMSLKLYGPLAFIQSWERGPMLSSSDIDQVPIPVRQSQQR